MLKDLKEGMILEGVVTNVTNFGAFVDIGVHQDGLVHISALAHKFVKDPREVVKTGDLVKVKVLEVDAARTRISLTMRLSDDADLSVNKSSPRATAPRNNTKNTEHAAVTKSGAKEPARNASKKTGEVEKLGTFADLFAQAKNLKKK